MTLEAIDLSDRSLFRAGFPHALFARLRREAPVWRHSDTPGVRESVGERGFWVVSSLDLVRQVARDEQTFSALDGPALRRFEPAWQGITLVSADGRAHRRLRGLINRGFTPRMIGRLEEQIRARARSIAAGIVERGECEFVHDVAYPLPMHMIADIVGIPESDRAYVFERVDGYMIAGDPEVPITPVQKQAMEREIFSYGVALAARKRAHPGDDVWSILTQAELPDEEGGGASRLSDQELALFFHVLALAGSETTRNSIALGVLALSDAPSDWVLLHERRELVPAAVEEMLRWASSTPYNRRTATRDTMLGGEKIAAGEKVTLWWASANRDESVFVEPFRFDVTRSPNPHLAFGHGSHFCLGASLARLEMRVVLEGLLDRFAAVALDGPVEWTRSNKHTGLRRMPVALTRRR